MSSLTLLPRLIASPHPEQHRPVLRFFCLHTSLFLFVFLPYLAPAFHPLHRPESRAQGGGGAPGAGIQGRNVKPPGAQVRLRPVFLCLLSFSLRRLSTLLHSFHPHSCHVFHSNPSHTSMFLPGKSESSLYSSVPSSPPDTHCLSNKLLTARWSRDILKSAPLKPFKHILSSDVKVEATMVTI